MVKLGERQVVLTILSEFNEHTRSCEIIGLIRDHTSKTSGLLEDDGLHSLLAVRQLQRSCFEIEKKCSCRSEPYPRTHRLRLILFPIGGVQRASGRVVTVEDVQCVMGHVRATAQSTHGGYSRQSAADPDILSKAIFMWWSVSSCPLTWELSCKTTSTALWGTMTAALSE